jgi:putative aminopeptidase FrvX
MKPDVRKAVDVTLNFLEELLAVPSPTGLCDDAVAVVERALATYPLQTRRTVGGALMATWKGKGGPERALTAHVDTIGLCVRNIKSSGRLEVNAIGGIVPYTVEGEYCQVRNIAGELFRGTVVPVKFVTHLHRDLGSFEHKMENLEVRLDAKVKSEKDVVALGIDVGDHVFLDTRTERTKDGFFKSRFLDDKLSVAILVGSLSLLKSRRKSPAATTHFLFSVCEEVGLGGAVGIPHDVEEMVVVDFGPVGPGQRADEYSVTFCMKDASAPYDLSLTKKLMDLARRGKIPYRRDIFPHYGSDRWPFLAAGGDAKVALLGPGVDGGHAWERTHVDAIGHTIDLVTAYLLSK